MLKRSLAFTCLHAAATLVLSVYAMAATLARLDGNDVSTAAAAAGSAADVLMLPGSLLWTSWASKNLSNLLEWLLFIGNSALWGLVISAALAIIPSRSSSVVQRQVKH